MAALGDLIHINNYSNTVYFPLLLNVNGDPWTGSGSYMIGMQFYTYSYDRLFWTGPVNFSSETTTITYNPNWEVELPPPPDVDSLITAYLAGGAGTYRRETNGIIWTKQ